MLMVGGEQARANRPSLKKHIIARCDSINEQLKGGMLTSD